MEKNSIQVLNEEINLCRQILAGNRYQLAAFDNVIKSVQIVLNEKEEEIKKLKEPVEKV